MAVFDKQKFLNFAVKYNNLSFVVRIFATILRNHFPTQSFITQGLAKVGLQLYVKQFMLVLLFLLIIIFFVFFLVIILYPHYN